MSKDFVEAPDIPDSDSVNEEIHNGMLFEADRLSLEERVAAKNAEAARVAGMKYSYPTEQYDLAAVLREDGHIPSECCNLRD